MTVKRATRVAERMRDELAAQIRTLNDPRVQGALVSRVEMPDDLSFARVFVRHELGVADEKLAKAMLQGLSSASHRMKKEIAKTLGLRRTPDLKFHYDEAPDKLSRIEEVLREIKRGE